MRIALIADVHANLPALQAALGAIRAHAPDRIVSLGDQINLGPCPRETLAALREANVFCLHGNHERYVLAAMRGEAAYAGANFESLRFNAGLLRPEEIAFPRSLELDGVTLCHAMPDDDRFPINEPAKALPRLRAMRPDKPLHVVCGHGHNPAHYRLPGITVDCIGSVGCMDDGVPGTTNYAILDTDGGSSFLRPYSIPYDTRPLRGLFVSSGMADFCPVMARLIFHQMTQNRDYLLNFVDLALEISKNRGETRVSLAAWREADARFPWPDNLTTAAFWRGH